MKPTRILKEIAGMSPDELPEDIRAQLEKNPALKAEVEEQAKVAALIGLKRYETPDEEMFGRVHYRTMIQLRNAQAQAPSPFGWQIPGWARAAAVVMFMLGLSVLTHREMLRTQEGEAPVAVSTVPEASEPDFQFSFQDSDPFAPYVLDPALVGPQEFSSGLTRKLEADFEALGLVETNALESATRLPVMLPAGP
jgi:hypothetical protein